MLNVSAAEDKITMFVENEATKEHVDP